MTPSSTPIRLAAIGCGGIASAYLSALAGIEELVLSAAVDVDAGRREAVSRTYGVPAVADVDTLLREHKPHAALLMTPPSTHEELALKLLRAGVHLLCEKPLAPTPAAAERMVMAAASSGRMLMMGSKFRYVDDMVQARRHLEAGLIGEPLIFENVFCSRVDMTRRWNSVRQVAGGGVLIDNGSHSVDVARYLCGGIERIQAQFARRIQAVEVEDTARILFETRSGVVGTVDLSWSVHKEVPAYVRLFGSKGALEVGWKSSRYKLEGDKDWTTFGNGYDKKRAFQNQLRNFARTLLGLEPPVITAEDALWSVRVIDAAYRSAVDRRWIEVGT